MYHHWINALQKKYGIRPLGPRDVYSKGLIVLKLHYMSDHVSVSRPHVPLVICGGALTDLFLVGG